jgi:CheY-like chemotaxis protein
VDLAEPWLPRERRRENAMNAAVLVVDDNEDNTRIISTILRKHGYEVQVARDGASALKALEESRPDVILLDVMMPEMDGLEVLNRVKANPQLATVPVILVTAKSLDEDVLAGYKGGADYYITKPFTPRQLLHGIGLVLGSEQPE